jgi:two-component system heavy metal sensor histidine kinase CusS
MQLERDAVDAAAELTRVREFYEAAASEAGVALEVEADPGLVASVDRTLFQRAVGNLVANGLAYTPAGGSVRMTACSDPGRDGVRVEVADTGCGIAPEHLPHIFERFYRVDRVRAAASGNVGLGLAIVKRIADLHGGSVTAESAPGVGTRVALWFPGMRAETPSAP